MFVQRSLRIHERRLLSMGLGNVERHRRLYRFYGWFFIAFVLLIQVYTYPMFFYVQTQQARCEVLTLGLFGTLFQLKIVSFSLHQHRIADVVAIMNGMEASSSPLFVRSSAGSKTAGGQPLEQAVRRTGRLVSGAWMMLIVVITTRFVQCLSSMWLHVDAERELIFPALLPVDWRTQDGWYVACNCSILAATMLSAFGLCSLDAFGPMMYMLLDGFVGILCDRIRCIGRRRHGYGAGGRPRDSGAVVNVEAECERELMECVVMHQQCLRIGVHLNRIFGVHYLFQFGACCIGLCAIVLIITQTSSAAELLAQQPMIMCAVVLATQVFMPCYFSDALQQRSMEVLDSLYACNWLERKARFRRMLVICMQRARRPMRFTTYLGVFDINLATFVKVCKTSYSILSCLT